MLISNKIHYFRNFTMTKLEIHYGYMCYFLIYLFINLIQYEKL